jgi:tRNA nucleotidyltransferase/poly(A) polymerase
MKFYEVGGAVRDSLMGVESKDVDFAVEAPSFEAMEAALKELGFIVFLSTPEFYTIRAQVPKGHPLLKRTKVADFVLCRKDSPTGDGRRPDFVEAGTILDDLARRDFTINAIARDTETGELIDPHGGQGDIINEVLKFVGNPMTRIQEDGLRVLRGFRFLITKELKAHHVTQEALHSDLAVEMLKKVSVERIREELDKMFNCDTIASLYIFESISTRMQAAIFRDGLRLTPTLKKV